MLNGFKSLEHESHTALFGFTLFSVFFALYSFCQKSLTPSPCVPLKENVRSGTFLCLIFLHDKLNKYL